MKAADMKTKTVKLIAYLMLFATLGLVTTACSDDALPDDAVVAGGGSGEEMTVPSEVPTAVENNDDETLFKPNFQCGTRPLFIPCPKEFTKEDYERLASIDDKASIEIPENIAGFIRHYFDKTKDDETPNNEVATTPPANNDEKKSTFLFDEVGLEIRTSLIGPFDDVAFNVIFEMKINQTETELYTYTLNGRQVSKKNPLLFLSSENLIPSDKDTPDVRNLEFSKLTGLHIEMLKESKAFYWVIDGIKLAVKQDGEWDILYFNPCANRFVATENNISMQSPEVYSFAMFSLNDTAICVEIETSGQQPQQSWTNLKFSISKPSSNHVTLTDNHNPTNVVLGNYENHDGIHFTDKPFFSYSGEDQDQKNTLYLKTTDLIANPNMNYSLNHYLYNQNIDLGTFTASLDGEVSYTHYFSFDHITAIVLRPGEDAFSKDKTCKVANLTAVGSQVLNKLKPDSIQVRFYDMPCPDSFIGNVYTKWLWE